MLLSPRGGGRNYQGQDVNPGSVAPQSKPWTVRPRRPCNCSSSAGTAGFRSSRACFEQLFRGAGLRTAPGLLPSSSPCRSQPGSTGSTSAVGDPSLGTARKWAQVFTINAYRDLQGVTRADCWGEQLCRVGGLWPLQRLSLPFP